MSTREDIEANRLAEWLDGNRDSTLSEEVAPAIYAIRPDWSPEPSVSIEDVLSRVHAGPFAQTSDEKHDDLPSEDDDFVPNLFAVSKRSTSPNTTLDDVFNRVQTGPFAEVATNDVANELVELTVDDPSTSAANNNRWWASPWLGMGVAVALVLIILLPNNFEAPQQEESIFAPSFESEEPPIEEVEAGGYLERTVPKSVERTSSAAKPLPSKTVFKERLDELDSNTGAMPNAPVEPSGSEPTRMVESRPTSTAVTTKSEPIPEMKKEADAEAKSLEPVNDDAFDVDFSASEGANAPMDMDDGQQFNDVVARKEFVEEEEAAEEMVPAIEVEDVAVDAVELSAAQMPASRTQSVEESVQTRDGVVGGMLSSRRSRGAKKSKAMAPAAEAMPASSDEMSIESSVESLPSMLSNSEQSTLRTADVESVVGMCDVQNPTKSLDVLWFASLNRGRNDAISLLNRSADYDHGDLRYLKRNWIRLSQLYAEQGNNQRAQHYQQMADALP
jgi:hypothetical protein